MATPATKAPRTVNLPVSGMTCAGCSAHVQKALAGAPGVTEANVAKWDEELKLRGRATREEWVEQAKELLAGKPPRAKADQAELASGEDY